jgi:hypothetical protein
VSLGGNTDAKSGRDDPITMVRNLHNGEIPSGRECKWEDLPAIVKEHLAAEGVYTEEVWQAKQWKPSTTTALDKPPFSACKKYLSCMGRWWWRRGGAHEGGGGGGGDVHHDEDEDDDDGDDARD